MSDSIYARIKKLENLRDSKNLYLPVKRGVDILLAFIILVLFSPLMIGIALGIHFFSPGPILYKQKRVGKNGQLFEMLKFRSMRLENAPDIHREYVQKLIHENCSPEDLGANSLKLKSDPRITGLGRILRKYSLDELPQLINVLRGEMSIVGPRPSLPYEYEIYKEWHKRRLEVLPGITGLWQVYGHNTVCFDDMVRLDLNYIRRMSLWLDIKIIMKTPFEMLFGKGRG
mgnify:CR=1 FL=1